jgi:hypothetical protein
LDETAKRFGGLRPLFVLYEIAPRAKHLHRRSVARLHEAIEFGEVLIRAVGDPRACEHGARDEDEEGER